MSDIDAGVCRAPDKTDETAPALPRFARLPINRCNLPAAILGGLTYQRHPTPLTIDGVADLHRPLWSLLDDIPRADERAERFAGYLRQHFRLEQPEDAGFSPGHASGRAKASYLRVVRGWAFDAESREAAIQRMLRADSEYKITGIKTTLPFFDRALRHPKFAEGDFDTGFVARLQAEKDERDRPVELAMAMAALAAYRARRQSRPDSATGARETSSLWWRLGNRDGATRL